MAIVTDGSSIDELVQYVRLYKPISTVLQGTILPFLLIYPAIFYTWVFVYGWNEHYEAGFVIVAGTAVVQILICLCCYWSVHVNCFLSCRSVNDPLKARVAKVVPMPNNGFSEIVKLNKSKDNDGEAIIWFMFQKTKYVYDWEKKAFATVAFPLCRTYDYYLQWKGFSDDDEVSNTEVKYGRNEMEMVIPEFMELFKEKATAPFFVFQVFCVALWCLDKYWYYSIFTLVMLIMFECTLVHQQLRNMAEIRKMGNSPYSINVYRSRAWRPMLSTQLVPGDIVSLTRSANDNLVPCDIVLLRGSCIVDESMLTGESVPQMKEPLETEGERLSDKIFDVEGDGKLHMLFGGTKIVQHSPPNKTSTSPIRAPNNGCIGYVVRTGFNTSQGKLLRTILFGVKRVTANNLETFGFILFLLIFAIAAAAYVWVKGCEDPERNRYKLFLECTLILTSVVPPELPIELSLAVNTSLISLSKLGVFCTEPFRIPFAGKIEICCFDKTGTLTSDNLVVEGVAGVKGAVGCEVIPLSEAPIETIQVLATCHSLVQLDDGIVGDPLEKATLAALDWNLTKGEAVIPKKGKQPGLKIFHRHHFSSALKRMSVLAGFQNNEMGFLETNYIATVKGAPETLKHMFSEVPSHYDDTYLSLSRRGARVLALGYRALGKMSAQEVRDVTREHTESKLNFAGFVIISCPLKADSKKSIAEIMNASHSVVMITGDNPLTACHVAKELKFTQKSLTVVCVENDESKWHWESIDSKIKLPLVPESLKIIDYTSKYDFCITGEALTYLSVFHQSYFMNILPHIVVFARFAPKQKEYVITQLKYLGFTTLMCGDGTNDVGALKHADVGVAILSNAPEKKEKTDPKEKDKKEWNWTRGMRPGSQGAGALRNAGGAARGQEKAARAEEARVRLKRALRGLDEAEQQRLVRLGDASVAAPFTSRMASVACICHIIKQGRCTLVTTLQMFKILALNALILAYSQSVLYLDGIKFSDGQATLQGLLLASCFLFISRSKPLSKLSKERPLPNIFNVYTVMTVLLQFFVHFVCLIYLVKEATDRSPPRDGKLKFSMDEPSDAPEVPFVPDLLNSTVYIISMALQISTFAINYRGEPFMEGLSANRPLLYSIICSGGAVMALAMGLLPDLASQFEIVNFPPDFRIILVQVLVADMAFAYIVDRACMFLFGEGKFRRS